MGVLKHIFGDDMTPEERARLEHGELTNAIAVYGSSLTGRSMQIFHDRFYGKGVDCKWCDEPRAERRAIQLQALEAAFARPAAEPAPVVKIDPVKKNDCSITDLERALFRSIMPGAARWMIIDPGDPGSNSDEQPPEKS